MVSYWGFSPEEMGLANVKRVLLPDVEQGILEPGGALMLSWHFIRALNMELINYEYPIAVGGFGRIGEFLIHSIRMDMRFDSVPVFIVDFIRREIKGQFVKDYILVSYKAYPDILLNIERLILSLKPRSVCRGIITVTNEGEEYGRPYERAVSVFSER